jgi:HEPN domain-containing protein
MMNLSAAEPRAQAAEKYLKCYLTYNDIIPQKTHNLVLLNDNCIDIDNSFTYMQKGGCAQARADVDQALRLQPDYKVPYHPMIN